MHFVEIVTTTTQTLTAHKLRTGLTMLGIIIGISAVILISSIGQGAVAFITAELSVFGTNYFQIAPGSGPISSFAGTNTPLTMDDVQALQNAGIANIESIAPFMFASSRISGNQEKTTTLVYGLTTEAQFILKPNLIHGRFINAEDDQNHSKVAVLGSEVAEELFGQNSNPVGETVRIDDARFKVIGVTKASGALTAGFFNNAVNIPISSMTATITGNDELIEIDISVHDEHLIDETIADVEAFLRDYRGIEEGEEADFYIQSFKDSLATVQTVTNLLTLLVTGISAISLVVGGIGIMNIMLVSVAERTREIGLLKAIGARDRDILYQVIVESITLSLLGGIIGIALGILGSFLISQAVNIPFILNPISISVAVAVSTLVGIIFGYYPARRAAHLHPIEALRYE